MDLPVRFHYGGKFLAIGGHLQYFGGATGMSFIDLDKISLPEIEGHLADHMTVASGVQLHWLYPGMELGEGLRLLHDDNACCVIPQHITGGGIADIYVEEVVVAQEEKVNEDSGLEFMAEDLISFRQPKDMADEKGKEPMAEDGSSSESSDANFDAEYQPKDMDSSGDDEEAQQLRLFAKQINMDIRAKKLGETKSQALIIASGSEDEQDNLEDDDSPYMNSSDDYSYEEYSEGECVRWKSTENRFDNKAHVPVFALGMAFRSSRQFKKALVKYGLTTHRHLLFPKDEKNKVRAVCS